MESLVGRTLGKYELTAMIGGGGMATVYEARHPGLDQRVAVKVLHPFLATDSSFVDRFRREAHAVAALRHPNIVRVLDSDYEGHLYYMVMEYIGGPTLSEVLSGRRTGGGLSLPEVYRIIPPLCSAVDYAAGRGMVHRDIKPANIILTEDGEPILTDYGIAKMMGSTSLTSPGTVVGSAHYMSPEQAQGLEADVRSDLYSLGVVLFECLAGTVPFAGDTTATVLIKHISAPVPSIRAARPNLPFALEPVVARALAKTPRDRYESGATFAEELVVALTPSKTTAVITEFVAPATLPPAGVPPTTPLPIPVPPVTPPPTPIPYAPVTPPPTPIAYAPVTPPPTPIPTTPPPVTTPPPPPSPPAEVPDSAGLWQWDVAATAAAAAAEVAGPPAPTFGIPTPPPADFTLVERPPLGPTGFEAPAAVEPQSSPAGPAWDAPPLPPPPPPPASTSAAPTTPPQGTVPVGQYEPYAPAAAAVQYQGVPSAADMRGGAPPRRSNRMRVIIVAALAVVLVAVIGTAAALALKGRTADPTTTTLAVTTTGTTALVTTTAPATTTSLSTTTSAPTTTTVKPTTTTVKRTTTTKRATVTTARKTTRTTKRPTTRTSTATTRRPVTTQATSPPDTIGPGNTNPPDTIGPG